MYVAVKYTFRRLNLRITDTQPSELQSVTRHTRSLSVTCHPMQVKMPHLNPSQTVRYSIYLPRRD